MDTGVIKGIFHLGGYHLRVQIIEKMLRNNGSTHRFLDIGCYDGKLSLYFSSILNTKEVYGVDKSKKAVASAKEKGIKAYELDLDEENLPFEDNYFDTILCGEVIEHLFDPDHLLDETYRVLKDDGLCILTTLNLGWWLNRFALLFGFQPFGFEPSFKHEIGKLKKENLGIIANHIKAFTLKGLKELLQLHNFSVSKIKGYRNPSSHNPLYEALNDFFTLFPSLSRGMVFVFGKEKVRQFYYQCYKPNK